MNTLQKKLDKKSSVASQKTPPKAPKKKTTTVVKIPTVPRRTKATGPIDPRQESYIFVNLCNTIPFQKEDEDAKHEAAKVTFRFLKNYIHERVPTCHLMPDPSLKWKPSITIDSAEEALPNNLWEARNYGRDYFVAPNGRGPTTTLRISHTEGLQDLLMELNKPPEEEELGTCGLYCSLHPSLGSLLCCMASGFTTPSLNTDHWHYAVMKEPCVIAMLKLHPSISLALVQRNIQNVAKENFPSKDDRIPAFHIIVEAKFHDEAVKLIGTIYRKKRKKGHPCNQKVIPIMNTSASLCKAKTNMTLMEEARKAQQKFLTSITKIELVDVIQNIDSRVYPGGPTLRDQVCGMKDPETGTRLFLGADQTGPEKYTLTCYKKMEGVAKDAAKRLGIIMYHRYMEAGLVPFHEEYAKKQIETFVFNPEINKYESTEDQVQKESLRQMKQIDWMDGAEHLLESDDEDDDSSQSDGCLICDMIMEPQGPYREETIVKMTDSMTASTMAAFRADAIRRGVGDSEFGDPISMYSVPETFSEDPKFASIYDIPGFPPPVQQSEITIIDPNGAKMAEAHFLPLFLQNQIKTHFHDEPPKDFKDAFKEWGTAWLDRAIELAFGQWNIRQTMLTMQLRERLSVAEFFDKYKRCKYETIMAKHYSFSIEHEYPPAHLLDCEDQEEEVYLQTPVIVFPPAAGTEKRQAFFQIHLQQPKCGKSEAPAQLQRTA